ncbi:MAG: dTMP kinase [bacterium]|nr:dTMP kinase [bacterium]
MSEGIKIAFDGPDGCGKTTQLNIAAEWLSDENQKAWSTRNMGGTMIGEAIRTVALDSDLPRTPETNLYISMALGTELSHEMEEKTSKGSHVLVDRSPMSVIAYQIFGDQLTDQRLGYDSAEKLMKLMGFDLILIFSAAQKTLDQRRKGRTDKPSDYYEDQLIDYHERVQEGYKKAVQWATQRELAGHVAVIDAERTVEEIAADVRAEIEKLL